jgi:hypothetical protein
VGKCASAVPTIHDVLYKVGTLRFAHPTPSVVMGPAFARGDTNYGIGKPFHNHSSAEGSVCATVGRSTCFALRTNRYW